MFILHKKFVMRCIFVGYEVLLYQTLVTYRIQYNTVKRLGFHQSVEYLDEVSMNLACQILAVESNILIHHFDCT